jgi:hypothetical protein
MVLLLRLLGRLRVAAQALSRTSRSLPHPALTREPVALPRRLWWLLVVVGVAGEAQQAAVLAALHLLALMYQQPGVVVALAVVVVALVALVGQVEQVPLLQWRGKLARPLLMRQTIPLVVLAVDKAVVAPEEILLVLLGFAAAVVAVPVEPPAVLMVLVVAVAKVKPQSNTQLLLAQLKP